VALEQYKESKMTAAPTSQSYFSHRLKLHYVEWGDPSKPTLMLVHGMHDHCRNWDWVAKDLVKDFHIIAPDLRGHGDSQWINNGSYSHLDFVADLYQLLCQVTKEEEKVSMICHSLGGALGLMLAGIFPEKFERIVAIEGLGPPPAILDAYKAIPVHSRLANWMKNLQKASSRTPRKYADLDAAIARMHEANSHLSQEQARHLSIHGLNRNEDGTYSWKFDHYLKVYPPAMSSAEETKTLLNRIDCPVLLTRGADSWAQPLEENERVAWIKNAETYTVKNAGHWLHHDQLPEFLSLCRKFLLPE